MKAKVDLRVEIVEGEDAGYVLQETNRLVDLQRNTSWPGSITPYKLILEFVTPDILRESHRRDNSCPEIDSEPKQGTWIKVFENEFTNGYQCSICGHTIQCTEQGLECFTTCKGCGAEMLENDEDKH